MELSYVIANSVDPDQTPRLAASDLDLHRLPSLLCDAKHKWVKLQLVQNLACKVTLASERKLPISLMRVIVVRSRSHSILGYPKCFR